MGVARFVAFYLSGKSQFGTSFHYGSLASDCCFITYRFWQICISPELPNRFQGSLPKQASDFSGRQIVFWGGQCSVHPSSKLLKLQKTELLTPEQLEFFQENKKLSSRVILPQKGVKFHNQRMATLVGSRFEWGSRISP